MDARLQLVNYNWQLFCGGVHKVHASVNNGYLIFTLVFHTLVFLLLFVFLKPIKNLWLSTYWGVLLLRSGCTENLPKRESMRGPGGHVGLTRNCTAVLSWAWDDSTNILPQTCGESTICTMLSLSLSCLHHVHLPSALWLMAYTSRVFATLCGGIMIYDWKVILS